MKLTLTNTFHNKEITLTPRRIVVDFGGKEVIEISRSTYNKISSTLCGSSECGCGKTFGDKNFSVFTYDARDGKEFYIECINGAFVNK
jgi:hypothetical protein